MKDYFTYITQINYFTYITQMYIFTCRFLLLHWVCSWPINQEDDHFYWLELQKFKILSQVCDIPVDAWLKCHVYQYMQVSVAVMCLSGFLLGLLFCFQVYPQDLLTSPFVAGFPLVYTQIFNANTSFCYGQGLHLFKELPPMLVCIALLVN